MDSTRPRDEVVDAYASSADGQLITSSLHQLADGEDPWLEAASDAVRKALAEHRAVPFRIDEIAAPDAAGTWFVSSVRLSNELVERYGLVAHLVTRRPANSRLPPRALRHLAQAIEVALAAADDSDNAPSNLEIAGLASRARAVSMSLATIAECCRAEGVVLWNYSYDDEAYEAVEGHGRTAEGLRVLAALDPRPQGPARGVIAQLVPGRSRVIYSLDDPSLRVPPLPDWEPHEPRVMRNKGWDAVVAWPVVAGGQLLGAISIYGPRLSDLRYDRATRNACTLSVDEYLRAERERQELEGSEATYEDELGKAHHGRLANELVHDYRSALDNIDTLLRNINRAQLPTGMRALYDQGTESITYLRDVTRSLSRLSKGGRSGGTCDLAEVASSSRAFLTALVDNVSPAIELAVRVRRPQSKAESTTVNLNELAALRIISNLVENAAIWCRSEDHPRVTVSISPSTGRHPAPSVIGSDRSDDSFVMLRVKDNGSGVRSSDRGRIFERGWTNRREDGGSGLGLYIVRKAIEDAGGWIEEEGRYTVGAEFVARLPPTS